MGSYLPPSGSYGPSPSQYQRAPQQSARLPQDWQFLQNSPMVGAPSMSDLAGALSERSNRGIPNDGFRLSSPPPSGPPSSSQRAPANFSLPPGFGSVPTGSYGIPVPKQSQLPDSRIAAVKNMAGPSATIGMPDLSALKNLLSSLGNATAKPKQAPPPAPAFDPMPMMMFMMMMKKRQS